MLKRLSALAVVAFLVTLAASSPTKATESVTFQVHLGAMMQAGTFNPATDSIVVRGDFQKMAGDTVDWDLYKFLMAKSTANDSIYTVAVTFPDTAVGKTIQYKFVTVHAGAANWESTDNRTYAITSDASQQTPLAYFNNQKPGLVATINITFQVDMTKMIAQGFNASVDSVYVVGGTPPLNWGYAAGTRMSPSFSNPAIYETTLEFTSVVGGNVEFKLFGAGADPFSNGGWESGSNHSFSFPSKDTTVLWTPDLNVTKASTEPTTVVFHVDMNKAYDGINYKEIKNVKGVWITGSVRPLNWPPSGWPLADTASDESTQIDTSAQLHKMYDDGTHGDSLAGDNRWSLSLTFRAGVSAYVEYKYGAKFDGYDTLSIGGVVSNGSLIDNESTTGVNHSLTLAGASMSAYNHFGDMDPANPGTGVKQIHNGVPAKFDLTQNYPNPFNPTTQINYSIPKNAFVTLKIFNVLGQEVATLYSGMQKAGNYVATFNAGKIASGVYFYRLSAGSFSSVKKMMFVK